MLFCSFCNLEDTWDGDGNSAYITELVTEQA